MVYLAHNRILVKIKPAEAGLYLLNQYFNLEKLECRAVNTNLGQIVSCVTEAVSCVSKLQISITSHKADHWLESLWIHNWTNAH